jgi:diadenosine tetraphosphatase ApaH/serine/threonine PP2A family protein phosphatase
MKVLVLSDVHSNLVALEAVFASAPSVDAIWNVGDTIGYGPRPRECLELMIERGAQPALVGNHDLACIGDVDLTEFNPVAQLAARWTALQLGLEHRGYLKNLPSMTQADGFTLAHASPRAPIWEYITNAQIAAENFDHFTTQCCFVGHTHIAMVAEQGDDQLTASISSFRPGETIDISTARYIINPGSVGQPRDRDPRAAFALLDTDQGTVTAHRVEYDIPKTQRQMALANLPEVLISRLDHGM